MEEFISLDGPSSSEDDPPALVPALPLVSSRHGPHAFSRGALLCPRGHE